MGALAPAAGLAGAAAAAAALLAADARGSARRAAAPAPDLRAALSAHRAALMLLTCVAILGVDFPAFPRRFAKAETYGTGLMDAGVGGIVAASGLAAGARAPRSRAADAGAARREAARVAALVALGAGRALATAAAGYQVHVGEYGAAWNFFLTLAALRAAAAALPRRLAASAAGLAALGAAVLGAHQYALSRLGAAAYVNAAERGPGFVGANKEGVLSLPGYLSLHLLAAAAGAALLRPAPVAAKAKAARGWRPVLRVAAGAAAAWAAFAAAARVEPVSRRSCNAAYVAWTLALALQGVALAAAAAALARPAPPPRAHAALNAAMLPAFLAANVLTGAVNLGVDTLAAPAWAARAGVAAYAAAVGGAALALVERRGGGGGKAGAARKRR
jgi:phosphatidylinositol glycan class W